MEGHGGDHPQPPGRRALFLLLPRHPGRQLGRRVVRAAAVSRGRDHVRRQHRVDQPRQDPAASAAGGWAATHGCGPAPRKSGAHWLPARGAGRVKALQSALWALERRTPPDRDPTRALHDAIEAIARIAERAAGEGAFDAFRRRQLVRRGTHVLSAIIQRGVESGAFRPHCARWAVESLPYAIVAGVCARWVFGLPEERSLGASAAADAALEALCPPVLASR